MSANLNRRIPLRDADRAPHRGDEPAGCVPVAAAAYLVSLIIIAILCLF
ncbi:hypothetical protein [Verrucomicrobium spinosum]|nr:hypothetical protein [Verrucomicrobium spinosum]